MNELHELLKLIQNVSWLFYLSAMLMFYYVSKKWANTSSSLITMVIAVAFSAVIIGYEEILLAYMEKHPGFNPVVSFFWFMGFATLEILGMATLYFVHKKENVRIGTLGQFIGFAFFTRCSLQLLQYSEIVLYKSNKAIYPLYTLYTLGMPSINISIAVVSFCLAAIAIYHLHFHEKGLRGLKRWTI